MYMDFLHVLSDAQAVTDTAASTNVYDLGAPGTPPRAPAALSRQPGPGMPIYLVIACTTTVLRAAGAATITFALRSSAAVTTGALSGTITTHIQTAAISKADLVAGYDVLRVALPLDRLGRYIDAHYTMSAAVDSGAFDAFLTDNVQTARK